MKDSANVKCECGFFWALVEEPNSLMVRDGNSENYALQLSNELRPIVRFCPLCGGRELPPELPGSQCNCGALIEWANDSSIPVGFDPEVNEYYVTAANGANVLLYYCPKCGGRGRIAGDPRVRNQ